MTVDLINNLFAVIILAVMTVIVWQSTVIIQEKKERQRKGLTDYYDNPIDREVRCKWDLEKEA